MAHWLFELPRLLSTRYPSSLHVRLSIFTTYTHVLQYVHRWIAATCMFSTKLVLSATRPLTGKALPSTWIRRVNCNTLFLHRQDDGSTLGKASLFTWMRDQWTSTFRLHAVLALSGVCSPRSSRVPVAPAFGEWASRLWPHAEAFTEAVHFSPILVKFQPSRKLLRSCNNKTESLRPGSLREATNDSSLPHASSPKRDKAHTFA